jgi:NADPH-dependent 2,4-dienoyl-CoA reductase/sulfur reductase-like enzyme
MDSFMSPLTNTLAHPYGGSFDNRIRFAMDVLEACRKRVGEHLIFGVRYVADEVEKGGTTEEEGVEVAQRFKASGLVDFVNIIRGRVHTDAAMTDVVPVQGMKSAPHLDIAGRIRQKVGLPTFHAGRIADPATARHAVATGQLDMVGMTRAHMADPHIVRKIMEGRESAIRPCVGANYCLDRLFQGNAALCIHNPATGREELMPHSIPRAAEKRRVVVVGTGPAGLEAARVAGERGHRVIVFEAADQPGGQVRLMARTRRRAEMNSIIHWRMEQCATGDVEFRFNTWAEADVVLAESPDVVVIATGGLPNKNILETGNELTVSAWDILSGDVKPGNDVLLYDDAGDHTAMQAAEILAESGATVEVMTRDRSFAPEVMGMNLVPYMRTLQDKTVAFTVTYRLLGVERDGNRLRAFVGSDYMPIRQERHFDQIVVNNGTRPLDQVYFELKPLSLNRGAVDYDALIAGQPQALRGGAGGFQLYRIGDAIASRNIHTAVYDALRLMKNI